MMTVDINGKNAGVLTSMAASENGITFIYGECVNVVQGPAPIELIGKAVDVIVTGRHVRLRGRAMLTSLNCEPHSNGWRYTLTARAADISDEPPAAAPIVDVTPDPLMSAVHDNCDYRV